ncbi:hypothetical protein ACWFQ8_29950 [Streptomyces sp. NPDC055254]
MTHQPAPLPDGFTAHTCISAKCALCGYFHDEDEGATVHFESLAEAHSILRSFDWVVLADGRPLCQSDDEDHKALKLTVGLAPDPTA